MPPSPTVSRPSTPVSVDTHPSHQPQQTPPNLQPSSSNAMVLYKGSQAIPTRRPTTPTEASTSAAGTSAASSSSALVATRRKATNAMAKAQSDRAAAEAAQQLHQLALREIGSTEPAAIETFFHEQVPLVFGHASPAEARLLELVQGLNIPQSAQIIHEGLEAFDRITLASLGGAGEGTQGALTRTASPADQATVDRMMGILEQAVQDRIRAAGEGRIQELSDTSSVSSHTAPPTHEAAAATDGITLEKLTEALKAGPDFAARVFKNTDFDTSTAQWLATTTNVVLRNLASVGATTFGRELLAFGIQQLLDRNGVSSGARTAISFAMGPGYATVTHLAGMYRDSLYAVDTEASRKNLRDAMIGRTISILTAGAAFAGEMAMGLAPNTAATHAAMTAYTHGRDVGVQPWLRLPAKQDPAEDLTHFLFMSGFYGLDQAIVPGLMLALAPTSGANAARAGFTVAETAKAAGIRAALNTAGEIAEDLANEGNRAIRAGHTPEVGLQVDFKRRHFVNGLLGPQSVRTAIISEAQSLLPIIATMMAEKHSATQILLVQALTIGLINGIQYWPFARGFGAQPKVAPPPADLESGHEMSDLESSSSASSASLQIEELDNSDPRIATLSTGPVPTVEEPDDPTRRAA